MLKQIAITSHLFFFGHFVGGGGDYPRQRTFYPLMDSSQAILTKKKKPSHIFTIFWQLLGQVQILKTLFECQKKMAGKKMGRNGEEKRENKG